MSALNLAAEFVRKDEDLKRIAKQITPVRKQRKELYETLLHTLEAEESPERQAIEVGGGRVVRLKAAEGAVPVKEEYVAQRLRELLGLSEAQAQEIASKIWAERPKVVKYKLVCEGAGGSSGRTKRRRAEGAGASAE